MATVTAEKAGPIRKRPLDRALTALWTKGLADSHAFAIRVAGGPPLPFDPTTPAGKAIYREVADRIEGIEAETQARVRRYVARARLEGLSPEGLANLIRTDPSGAFSRSRARAIARTESGMAYNRGSILGYRDSGRVKQVRVFDGDGCILPGQPWIPVGEPNALWRGWFDGYAVRIGWQTSDGVFRELAVSPNHPILTDSGWTRAEFVNPNHKLIHRCGGQDANAFPHTNVNNMPMIEETFEAWGRMPRLVRPTLPGDLHEDGVTCQGEVCIVLPDRELLDERHAALFEHGRQLALMWSDGGLPGVAPPRNPLALSRLATAAGGGGMGGGGSFQLLGFGQPVPSDLGALCLGACQPVRADDLVDRSGVTPQTARNGGGANEFGRVEPDDLRVAHSARAKASAFSGTEPALRVVPGREDAVTGLALGQLGSAGCLVFSHGPVLWVDRFRYCGPVYDVSAGGYYIVNDAILANCSWPDGHGDGPEADGMIVDLDEAEQYPLAHVNCTRSFAAVVESAGAE